MARASVISSSTLDGIINQALASAHGVAVETDDPARLRARLYPRLKALNVTTITLCVGRENQLWLMKKAL